MAKRLTILEDDQGILEVIEMIFLAEGFEVQGFASVNDFMKEYQVQIPDIFLLDVMLPDGDGLKICNHLKSISETSATPVLMMSAHANITEMKQKCAADGFIAKPFDINHLIEMVNSFS